MSDTGPSDAARAGEIRRALDRLRADLHAAGIDLEDPRARQLVIAAIGGAGDRRLGAAAQRALALDLRAGGHSYREIAAQLGWKSDNSARKAVKKALEGVVATLDEPEEVRALELERLDAMWRGLAPKALKGDARSVMAAVRLMGERRHLVPGLDVLGTDPDAVDAGAAINVFVQIPDAEHVTPVPQDQLGEIIEARSRELPAPSEP